MKEMVDVIAVVVTHNRKRLLLRCLRAIFSQTSKVTKVIVVDNAFSVLASSLTKKSKECYGLL